MFKVFSVVVIIAGCGETYVEPDVPVSVEPVAVLTVFVKCLWMPQLKSEL